MFSILEKLFVIVLLLSSMGAIDAITQRQTTSVLSVSAIATDKAPTATRMTMAGIYAWGLILITIRSKRVLGALGAAGPLLGFVVLAALSTLWSIDTIATLQRSFFLLVWTVLAVYLGERYSVEQLASLLAVTLCLMIMAVIALHYLSPTSIIDQRFAYDDAAHRGAWTGLSRHKNDFGSYMALAIIVLLFIRLPRFRAARFAFIIAAAVLLLLSRSATSIVLCVVIVTVLIIWRATFVVRGLRFIACVASGVLVCAGIWIATTRPMVLIALLGRESTLTGRTQLWRLVMNAISQHPYLGYGYAAFWEPPKGETLEVWSRAGFLARDAASGYLDVCLAFGVLGLPLFLYILLHYFRHAVDYFKAHSTAIALWPATYICFFALHNIFESSLMDSWRSLPFLMLVAVGTSVAMRRRRSRVACPVSHANVPVQIPSSA